MKKLLNFRMLFAATSVAFASLCHAQIITYSTDTQHNYGGSVATISPDLGSSAGEKFTNISAMTSMTYNFFAGSANGNVSALTNLTATFGEWNGSGFVSGTTVDFDPFTVQASTDASWSETLSITGAAFRNFSYTFDFTTLDSNLVDGLYGYVTNPAKTYALILTNTSGATNLALGVNYSDPFAYGGAFGTTGPDFVFSQISVVPGTQTITPEPGTVAGILGCLFVAGLVGFRLYQQRQTGLAPVVAA